MSVTPRFKATYKSGKVHLEDPQQYTNFIYGNFKEGDKVAISIKKWRKPRTTGKSWEDGDQNGWYWGCILPISAKELGYTIDEMHEVFIAEFAPYTIKKCFGKTINVRTRTSDMNTVQFTEYVETIRMKMAEMGIEIPDPINVDYQ